jgi:hypothetical protein
MLFSHFDQIIAVPLLKRREGTASEPQCHGHTRKLVSLALNLAQACFLTALIVGLMVGALAFFTSAAAAQNMPELVTKANGLLDKYENHDLWKRIDKFRPTHCDTYEECDALKAQCEDFVDEFKRVTKECMTDYAALAQGVPESLLGIVENGKCPEDLRRKWVRASKALIGRVDYVVRAHIEKVEAAAKAQAVRDDVQAWHQAASWELCDAADGIRGMKQELAEERAIQRESGVIDLPLARNLGELLATERLRERNAKDYLAAHKLKPVACKQVYVDFDQLPENVREVLKTTDRFAVQP